MTERHDDGSGGLCSTEMGSSDPTKYELLYAQAYCCLNTSVPTNFSWTFSDNEYTYDPKSMCIPEQCPSGKVEYTFALDPDDPEPVDPDDLWEDAYASEGSDVDWAYSDDSDGGTSSTDYGADPYGFVMLDGPSGSIDSTFGDTYTVVQTDDSSATEKVKRLAMRSLVTSNATVITSNFDNTSETLYVYCQVAVDTIIRLPSHVGEGPWARVVSMTPVAHTESALPSYHLHKREAQENSNPVYALVIDYNFQDIQDTAKQPVNMRVDFANLEDYWQTIDDSAARKVKKRTAFGGESRRHIPYRDWRRHVDIAKKKPAFTERSSDDFHKRATRSFAPSEVVAHDRNVAITKRWFGALTAWLKKVTTITKTGQGDLPIDLESNILLYSQSIGCSKANAEMNIYLNTKLDMAASYAYYFSGTIVPPAVTDTYAARTCRPSSTGSTGLHMRGQSVLGPAI
ncbi:uncharacterized protein N7483_008919 [Penicillium malachiteum]|uniref:uncharacterized protein n=1 Tax=Penicillium malachiteum TaxID=1324776 RepID=UPI002547663E|nr:uncharacterized protein N7483_008919 [Penicillium malachiteum]KAJ5720985.1 hypothetical protein N7483_008919 [Penicillium malachiteum]